MSRIDVWLKEKGMGNVVHQEFVGGGCINNSMRLHLDSGTTVFLKQNSAAPEGMFQAEAIGLQALAARNAIKIPDVIHVEEDFLLIEDLGQGPISYSFWKLLGESLAKLHSETSPQFGFSVNNYCGLTTQVNTITDDGFEFFANYRILKLASSAFHQNLIERQDLIALESIAANLSQLIPPQNAVLIHGDLWSGNYLIDKNGFPWHIGVGLRQSWL